MFRPVLIAITLVGMSLCQYRCQGGGAAATPDAAATAGCACCGAGHQDSHRPNAPAGPARDGDDCECQGVCGGAVTSEAVSAEELRLAGWAVTAPAPTVTPRPALVAATSCDPGGAPAPADGRLTRIRLASLLV